MGKPVGNIVFAALFGGVGVFTGWLGGVTVYDSWRSRDWAQVSAEPTGDYGFRYTWRGRTYTSWRLTAMPFGESDVDGSDVVLERLERARASGKPLTVHVNPQDPSEAMAERAFPWKFVSLMTPFVFGFGGGAIAALWGAARSLFPWVAWLRAGASSLPAQWLITVVWNGVAVPITVVGIPDIVARGEWLGLLILFFPLVGAALLWGALAATFKRLRERGGPASGETEMVRR